MLDFREKKKIRKTMYSKPILIILAVFLVLCVKGTWEIAFKYKEAAGKAAEAKAELVLLQKQKLDIEKKLDFMQTERGIEEEIRGKFMVAKEGEGVIMVVDPKPATATPTLPKRSFEEWSGFLNFFR